MRSRVGLALFLSLVLIIGATWFRVSANKELAAIISVNNSSQEDLAAANLPTSSADLTAASLPSENLTTTDLISRQLMTDYISLAASGQATEANITTLANQYVERIPSLNQPSKISSADIVIVPDSSYNFEGYAKSLTAIHDAYQARVDKFGSQADSLSSLGQNFYSFASAFNNIYSDTAQKLKNISVPKSLAEAHLKLINNYLASAYAMKAIAATEEDSASAFAALSTMNDNLSTESSLYSEISMILSAHGQ